MHANTFYHDGDLERMEATPAGVADTRGAFEIDRDRVIHSSAFRRLQNKTQVFLAGEYDFYRTRLTHSIEVAQIGRSICRQLARTSDLLGPEYFIDADLVEAVCLAHDLGHPPFGHAGERVLNQLMHGHGGFEGNAQTLRLLTQTIYQSRRGMNPSRAFIDGVLKYKALHGDLGLELGHMPEHHFLYDEQSAVLDFAHYREAFPTSLPPGTARNRCKSIECQIMDWADDTAYSIHDVVDGIHAGFLDPVRVARWAEEVSLAGAGAQAIERLLEAMHSGKAEPRMERRIGGFIHAVRLEKHDGFLAVRTNRHAYRLEIDREIREECAAYKRLAYDLVFQAHQLKQLEYKGERMLGTLFRCLEGEYLAVDEPRYRLLPPEIAALVTGATGLGAKARQLCDYLAGMTDGFAIRTVRRLTDPEYGGISDLV